MHAHRSLGERVAWLGHGYKELEIPPASKLSGDAAISAAAHGRFALEPHALHIWPRGGYMCIALPNTEGSFTVTLFLPNQPSQQPSQLPSLIEASAGASFAELENTAAASAFFASQFPDLLRLMPQFARDYASHPVGTLATLYLDRWHLDGRAVLLGDAAHAIVPFHGQGMNCGFEDTVVLADLLAAAPHDSAAVFAEFQRRRQPNAQAIAQMAIENYEEMRHAVTDPHYLARRALGAQMEARVPGHFMSRYRMVSFTHLPYAYALERGRAQDAVLTECLRSTSARTGADLAGADLADMDLASIDLEALAQRCRDALPPLPPLRHA
jgi:kynurenine 3-monooxygenase